MNILQIFLAAILILFAIYCGWTLVTKTGNPGWLCFLFCIPVVNVLIWLYFVFTKWPVEVELIQYRKLYGDLPDNNPLIPSTTESTCLNCKTKLNVGINICPKCGWTYLEQNEE